MKREIKFRGQVSKGYNEDFYKQNFVYGSAIICEDNISSTIINNEFEAEVDTYTIGQFTGLKDKNGIDIYEGDIVIVTEPATNGMAEIVHNPVAVTWHEEIAGFNLGYVSNTMDIFYDYEIIGNVHQNPDILGTVQK